MRKLNVLCALGFLVCVPVLGQEPSSHSLNGTWKATFADSLFSGTVYLTLGVQDDSTVSGTYKATTGGFGTVTGKVEGQTFHFTLTQTVEGCPGSYSGSLVLENEQGTGTYAGHDCQGEHENGVVSMVPATPGEVEALKSPEVFPAGDIYSHGRGYWVSKSDKYLVLISAEQKDYLTLLIAIQNDSNELVTFDPEQVVVEDLVDGSNLRYYSPDEVAQRIRKKGGWKTFLRALAAGMQAFGQSQPTRSYHYGNYIASDPYGNFVYGNYRGTTTTYSAPDTTEIQRQAATDISSIRTTTETQAANVAKSSAKIHTLMPKSYILGTVRFSKAKKQNLRQLVGINKKDILVRVSVPLGGDEFKFMFPIKVVKAHRQQN